LPKGQADPSILKELYVRHVGLRRAFTIALIERGKAAGEFLRRHRYPDVRRDGVAVGRGFAAEI
jgi:hypothetical protein